MANNFQEILAVVNKGNQMGLSNTIKRNNGIPLDFSSVQETYEAALDYAKNNPLAYIGQPIAVGDTLYVVASAEHGYLKAVGTQPAGDNKSIEVSEDGIISLAGFTAAEGATLPQKQADGTIKWVAISAIVEGDGNTKTVVKAAEGSDITVTPEYDEVNDTYTYTLDVQVPAVPEYSVTKETADNQVTYKLTKDGTAVGEAIVVPNAYNDSAITQKIQQLEADHARFATKAEDIKNVTDRLDVLEGDGDGSVAKAVADLKTYVDGLAENYDAAGAAADALSEAKAHTAAEITGLELSYTENKIQLSNKEGAVVAEFDASVFVQDSFLDDVKYENGKIKFTWTMGDGSTKSDEVDVADFVPVYTVAEKSGLTLNGNEFGIDTEIIATKASVDETKAAAAKAQSDIDSYKTLHADDYTNGQVDTKITEAIGALNVDTLAKKAEVVSNETFDTFKEENTAAIAKAVKDQADTDATLFASKSELNAVNAQFGNYTNTETLNGLLAKKADAEQLDGYYKKTETYSSTQIDELLEAVSGGSSETAASVKVQLDAYKQSNDDRVAAVEAKNTAQETAIKNNADAIAEIKAADTGILAQAKAHTDLTKSALESAYKSADTALGGRIDNVLALINDEGTGLNARVAGLTNRADTAESEISSVKTTLSNHSTKLSEHTTAIENLTAKDNELDAKITSAIKDHNDKFAKYSTTEQMEQAIADAIGDIDNAAITNGIAENAAAIAAEVNRAKDAEAAINDRIVALVGDVEGDDTKTIRTIATEEVVKIVAGADTKFDTLKEIADWIANDTTGAAKMANDIVALDSRVDTVEASIAAIKLPGVATDTVLGIVLSQAATVDNAVQVAADGKMSVARVNVNSLVQTAGDELVLNGGSSNHVSAD